MTDCRWCDVGQHPFPASDPGAMPIPIARNVANQWGGTQPSNIPLEACGACAHDLQLDEVITVMKPEEILERSATIRENTGGTSPRPKHRPRLRLNRGDVEDVDDRTA